MEKRTFEEIQGEIFQEQEKLKQPLSDQEEIAILMRIKELLEERKGAVNG
jgi:hypothetical protein